ncbi:Hypothetical_protein [Hexamita inflata]|uniref:Hypothetical_protein n=1 Tax=Hexamita inflata TaxID=28002 RepID=A0ABP1KFJ0_9EUKA
MSNQILSLIVKTTVKIEILVVNRIKIQVRLHIARRGSALNNHYELVILLQDYENRQTQLRFRSFYVNLNHVRIIIILLYMLQVLQYRLLIRIRSITLVI